MIDKELEVRMQMAQDVTSMVLAIAPQGEHQSPPTASVHHDTGSG